MDDEYVYISSDDEYITQAEFGRRQLQFLDKQRKAIENLKNIVKQFEEDIEKMKEFIKCL